MQNEEWDNSLMSYSAIGLHLAELFQVAVGALFLRPPYILYLQP